MDLPVLRELRQNLTAEYPFGGPGRHVVQEDEIDWSVPFPEYDPWEFTLPSLIKGNAESADEELRIMPGSSHTGMWPKWNIDDGVINRKSHHGNYEIDGEGYPLNPAGRTGIKGRGCLGRWATNHVVDCLITRWKKDEEGTVVVINRKPVLQFVGMFRDNGAAVFPGGMIHTGETPMTAVKRKFWEEVFSLELTKEKDRTRLTEALDSAFENARCMYKGYVDDHRNTDNAWIEVEAMNVSLNEASDGVFKYLKIKPGDRSRGAGWIDITRNIRMIPSQEPVLRALVKKLDAYW